jgi:hypothetical protein
MVDNLKTAVLAHPLGGPVVLNPRYAAFAAYYDFTIKPCGPRRANEKGRIENAIGYIRKNFLAGREITDFAALKPAVRDWLDTIANVREHGETKRTPLEMFAEEKEKLRPAPAQPYDAAEVIPIGVSARCRVVVETNRYSVPPAYASKPLTLKLYADRLRLYAGEGLVTTCAVTSATWTSSIPTMSRCCCMNAIRPASSNCCCGSWRCRRRRERTTSSWPNGG